MSDIDRLRSSLSLAIKERDKWLAAGPDGWAKLRPNTNAANSVDYAGHMRVLNETIDSIQKQIKEASDDCWEFISEVDT